MIFPFAGAKVHAPEGVVPAVAFPQFSVSGIQQLLPEGMVLGKLSPDDLLHNA